MLSLSQVFALVLLVCVAAGAILLYRVQKPKQKYNLNALLLEMMDTETAEDRLRLAIKIYAQAFEVNDRPALKLATDQIEANLIPKYTEICLHLGGFVIKRFYNPTHEVHAVPLFIDLNSHIFEPTNID